MDDVMIATHFENIDRRLDSIEQILPTLAIKEELRLAIAPLATKVELQEFRRHMDVLLEALRTDIQLLAEHVASAMRRHQE